MAEKSQNLQSPELVKAEEPHVSKMLTDRIRADGEQVGHVLEPDRADTVLYPDPTAAGVDDAGATTAPSNAQMQMARRTDAGPRTAPYGTPGGQVSRKLGWLIGGVALLLVVALLIAVL